MTSTAEATSVKSTSASSRISEEAFNKDLFPNCENLCFVKKLSDAKFPVYLVCYTKTRQLYAMKIFPWEDDEPSPFFVKEIRFAQFSHPNIISMIYCDYAQETCAANQPNKVSYILMDYAKYGDFFDVLISYKIHFNDALVRTYFHQLIEALEVLHSKGAAHLDIKLENLLMNEDYALKLTDFDLSFMSEDKKVKTRGTKNFRAPEMLSSSCTDPQASDIYSAGIILFLMKTEGMVPYKEDESINGVNMEDLKHSNPKMFWEKQLEFLEKKSSFFSEDFKFLFMWMTRRQPEKRPTIAKIKNSRWYKKKVYTPEEVFAYLNGKFELS
jgi:serine/threonine protein kinase